jgi:hypothetical protein
MRSGVLKETAFPSPWEALDTNACRLMAKDRLPALRR